MEVLQALDDLSNVETGSGLLKPRVVLIHQVDVVPSGNREQVSFSFIVYKRYVICIYVQYILYTACQYHEFNELNIFG